MKGHIRKRGKESWELKFDAGRDPTTGRRKIAYHSFRGTKREAESKLAELIAAIAKGSYVEPSKITVAEHVRARLRQWTASGDIGAKTAERYGELVENQIVPHLGARPLQKLKPLDIEEWHSKLRESGRRDGKGGVSARTIGHAHRVLSHALKDAAKNDMVSRNVAALEPPPQVNEEEVEILADGEIKELITKLRGRAMYPKAITSLFTGLRRGELLAARWIHTDIDGGNVIEVREALEETKEHGIRFKLTKTRSGRRDVTLPDIVVEALREHRRQQLELRMALGLGKLPDNALLFPAMDGGPQSPRAFSAEWADVAAGLGLPHITFHALRHTHASQLIDAGIDVVTISKRLGHASANVTLKVYAHLFRQRDDKAAAAINAALAGFGKA